MGEIKISVSDKMDRILESRVDKMGIKKTEFVKSIVIENLKTMRRKKHG